MDHYVSMLLAAAPERRSEIVLSDVAAAGLQSGKLQPMTITLDALLLQDPSARKLESRQYAQLGVTRTVVYPETYDAEALGRLQNELPEMTFKSVPNGKYVSGDFMDELYSDFGRMSEDQRSHMVIVSAEDQKVVGPGMKRLEVSRNGSDGSGAAFVTKAAIEVALSTGKETAADLASLGIKVVTKPGRETIYRYEQKMEPFLVAYIQRILHSITQTSTAA